MIIDITEEEATLIQIALAWLGDEANNEMEPIIRKLYDKIEHEVDDNEMEK